MEEKMKRTISTIFALLLSTIQPLVAQPKPADPVGENLFPPELVMRFHAEIGLTEEQRESIQKEMEKAQPRFTDLHQQLGKQWETLAVSLKKERIDEKLALAQLDQVQSLEREIRRTQVILLIGMKNRLTPEQQAKLQEINKQLASGKQPLSLQDKMAAKMEKLKAGIEKWQNDGRDPSPIGEVMEPFGGLLNDKKFKDADALLDKALKLLDEPK
jgi:Spy/CpxP family protein refolding chaperone